MKITKLTKQELAEGLTLEMVNRVNMYKGYSPIQLRQGDEPIHLLKCSAGYWVRNPEGEGYLRDERGTLLVFDERECQIGRARYLQHYGFEEKQLKAEKLIASWLEEVRQKLDALKLRVEVLEGSVNGREGMLSQILKQHNPTAWAKQQAQDEKELGRLKPQYEELEAMYQQKEFVGLLGILDIKKFDSLMLVARLNNSSEMEVLKNTFSRTQIDNWDGDTLLMYARLEVEKEYAGI
ncbi:hypothetical protein [Telluribacter humicola]|uniref:hypothetical protein n=1 Tax=Telluribacter humicola TaxID=1720261 RepID=UPI001A96FE4F|nr:hypothetical protein [Telluribacter humicola]